MPEYLETTIGKFIFRVAAGRRYSQLGIWVQTCEDGCVRLGLSDYVQQRSGDMAFVHLKPVGTRLSAGDEFAEVETIKATVSLPVPVSGEIVEVNGELEALPELVNEDPYGKGWLVCVRMADGEPGDLLEPQAYLSVMRGDAEEELKSS